MAPKKRPAAKARKARLRKKAASRASSRVSGTAVARTVTTRIGNSSDEYHKVSGTDLIAQNAFTTAGASPVSILSNIPINDSIFFNTRLGRLFSVFEKFRFKKLVVRAVPCVPSTSSTFSYSLTYDRDPSDLTPTADFAGLQQLAAQENFVSAPACEPISLRCTLGADWLFTNGNGETSDERLFTQGQIYLAQIGNAPSALNVQLYFDYEIEFSVRNFDPAPLPTQFANGIAVGALTVGAIPTSQTILAGLNRNVVPPANITTYVDGLNLAQEVLQAPNGAQAIPLKRGRWEVILELSQWALAAAQTITPYIVGQPGSNIPPIVQLGAEIIAGTGLGLNTIGTTPQRATVRLIAIVQDIAGAYLSFGGSSSSTSTPGPLALTVRRIFTGQ